MPNISAEKNPVDRVEPTWLTDPSFEDFINDVRHQLEGAAVAKNYNAHGVSGDNLLYEAVAEMTGGQHHALAEIVYKARRFLSPGARGGDVTDLVKIASWAFLAYKYASRK